MRSYSLKYLIGTRFCDHCKKQIQKKTACLYAHFVWKNIAKKIYFHDKKCYGKFVKELKQTRKRLKQK